MLNKPVNLSSLALEHISLDQVGKQALSSHLGRAHDSSAVPTGLAQQAGARCHRQTMPSLGLQQDGMKEASILLEKVPK